MKFFLRLGLLSVLSAVCIQSVYAQTFDYGQGGGSTASYAVATFGSVTLAPGILAIDSAVGLTGDITVTPPAGIELRNATLAGAFSASPLILVASGGKVLQTTIEYRPTSYTFSLGRTNLGNLTVTTAPAYSVAFACGVIGNPALISVIQPQYLHGHSGTENRLVNFFRLRLEGLAASTQYRYAVQVMRGDDETIGTGAGNQFFIDNSGQFRFNNAGLSLANGATGHDTLTTDASGNYEGWFGLFQTNNSRFNPGFDRFIRIQMATIGSTSIDYHPTTTLTSRTIATNFPRANTDSTARQIRGLSNGTPKDFVLLYDNTAGTGRPLSVAVVESDGAVLTMTTSAAAFYKNDVDGQGGRWGTFIPSTLANGVRRIELRDRATGAVRFVSTDADGIWPSGANTVNVAGGSPNIGTSTLIAATDAPLDATSSIEGGRGGEALNRELRVGPNPSVDRIQVMGQVSIPGRLELELMNLSGASLRLQVAQVDSDVNQEVSIADLAPGFYVLKGRLGSLTGTWRIIKQ